MRVIVRADSHHPRSYQPDLQSPCSPCSECIPALAWRRRRISRRERGHSVRVRQCEQLRAQRRSYHPQACTDSKATAATVGEQTKVRLHSLAAGPRSGRALCPDSRSPLRGLVGGWEMGLHAQSRGAIWRARNAAAIGEPWNTGMGSPLASQPHLMSPDESDNGYSWHFPFGPWWSAWPEAVRQKLP